MSTWMLLIVSTLYFATGIDKLINTGSWPWFGFWTSYAIANLCWIAATNSNS